MAGVWVTSGHEPGTTPSISRSLATLVFLQHLRCASLCVAVRRCASLCVAVRRCASLCVAVRRCPTNKRIVLIDARAHEVRTAEHQQEQKELQNEESKGED